MLLNLNLFAVRNKLAISNDQNDKIRCMTQYAVSCQNNLNNNLYCEALPDLHIFLIASLNAAMWPAGVELTMVIIII